ncbi:MAG: hypothetical protein GY862_00265, partial [Gammaproteobacteria bacterium]|nr:hypothetical protein [Gammaproteobacteria bacterium]
SLMPTTKFSLPFGREEEFFPIEIVISPDDADRCFPCVYAPAIFNAQSYGLSPQLIEKAWESYENKLSGDPEYTDDGNSVIYISLKDDADDGAPWVYESEELKLVRFGVRIVRVYGPASVTLWEKDGFEDWVKRDVDMAAQQKLACTAALSQDFMTMESELYGLPAREETEENRGGFTTSIFDASMEGEDNTRTGRFCQQQTEKAFPLVSYRVKLDFFGEQFVRTYVMPGNQGPASGNQVEKIGRKTHTIRETLQFNASTEEQIHYWYGDPEIRILEWSEKFVDIDGNELADDKKPNNLKRGETYNTPRGTRGPVFYSDVPCFGSIVVEYEAGYTEYQVLYDSPEPKRVFDITAGNIEKVGFITKDVNGEIVAWGTNLREESDIGGLLDQEIEVEGKSNIVQPIVRHVKLSDGTNKNPNTGAVIPKGEPLVSSDGLVDVDYDTEPCDYDKENDNPPCRKVAL